MLISDSRFDLVWFRLSCDHGWIRSGSVTVRKQQQQPSFAYSVADSSHHVRLYGNIILTRYIILHKVYEYKTSINLYIFPSLCGHITATPWIESSTRLGYVATAVVQGLVNCTVKARCQRIPVVG